jgi:hypothetical protein
LEVEGDTLLIKIKMMIDRNNRTKTSNGIICMTLSTKSYNRE